MGLVIDKISGQVFLFNISGGGTGTTSGSTYPEVSLFSSLPSAAANNGKIYVVLTSSGTYVVNRREAGLYYSNGVAWTRLGDIPSFFSSTNFQVYDGSDNTKGLRFQTSGVTTGQFRTLTIQNSSGTLAYLSDIGAKLDTSVFTGYTATTETRFLGIEADIAYLSGITDTKLNTAIFNAYTGTTAPVLAAAVTGGTSLGGVAIFAQKTGRNLEFKGLVQGANITLTPTATGVTISAASSTGSSGVSYDLFTGYTATTETRLQGIEDDIVYLSGQTDTKLSIVAFTGYSATTLTNINSRLLTSTFSGYTASTKTQQIILISTGVTDINTVTPTSIPFHTQRRYDTDHFLFTGGTNIRILTAGDYDVSFHVNVESTTASAKSIGVNVYVNGTISNDTLSATRLENTGSFAAISLPALQKSFAANDLITLRGYRLLNSGAANTVSNSVFISIRKKV